MIIEHTMNSEYLSNSYLVADEAGGHGVIIDTGGPAEPLLEAIEANELSITHILCTHHHGDHVSGNDLFRKRFDAPVCAHVEED